ncbi:DNA integrity scanning diadenylate cyclase DisA [Actinomyces mediterranea]|uniref:DNA integrity scanning diadenylate cyclase DisA n=1 Tax=Actinomyces mediterranea TaxID=1871028 RepID=UPI0009707F4A|nr:DNA integrity scanning diadenylate cyclase DisA [Actinomyces mediterranea]
MNPDSAALREALQAVAPGTALREGLERIKRSHTGALIVLGYNAAIESLCSGGFDLDVPFTAARLRELCKMDGAVVLDMNTWHIRKANVQLFPDPTIPTDESGMRHRTAQRTARQTHLPVLSLSASMRMISVYVGEFHRLVEEPEALLARANLAVDTLDRYSQRLDEVLQTLTVLEMRDSATIRDVATVMQRMEMIRRITSEINGYLEELGSEGRLLALQVDDLIRGSASERALVMRDYIRDQSLVASVEQRLSDLSSDKLVDLTAIANILGLGVFEVADLDRDIQPRGIRALSLVPHLPWNVIKEVSSHWPSFAELRQASADDLQVIEGIGPYRAKLIRENLEHQAQMAASGIVGW